MKNKNQKHDGKSGTKGMMNEYRNANSVTLTIVFQDITNHSNFLVHGMSSIH